MNDEIKEKFDWIFRDDNWGVLQPSHDDDSRLIFNALTKTIHHIDCEKTNALICSELIKLGRPVITSLTRSQAKVEAFNTSNHKLSQIAASLGLGITKPPNAGLK